MQGSYTQAQGVTWFTAGTVVLAAASVSRCFTPKLDTPMERTLPAALKASSALQASKKLPSPGLQRHSGAAWFTSNQRLCGHTTLSDNALGSPHLCSKTKSM